MDHAAHPGNRTAADAGEVAGVAETVAAAVAVAAVVLDAAGVATLLKLAISSSRNFVFSSANWG